MGLRMAEPCDNATEKADLFGKDSHGEWYAVQVAPHHEKKVTAALKQKRLSSFLPLVTQVHCWSDRKRIVDIPLFAGYTFVRLSQATEERLSVLRCHGVVRLVGKEHAGTPIPNEEIEGIRMLVKGAHNLEPYPYLNAGDRVRIGNGSLAGVEGILISKDSDTRLVVSVNLLQRSIAASIQGFDIEGVKVNRAARSDT